MTLLWFDGFENYSNLADMAAVRSDIIDSLYGSNSAGFGFGTGYGRTGRGLLCNSHDFHWRVNIRSAYRIEEGVVGYALRRTGGDSFDTDIAVCQLTLFDVAGGNKHIQLLLRTDFNWNVYRNTSFLGTTSGKTLIHNAWQFLEVEFKIADSPNGYVKIYYDGTEIFNETGIDTMEGSNAYVGSFQFRPTKWGLDFNWDDLYILNKEGSAPWNARLGDVKVDILRPDGIGNTTQFAPSAGDNFENVDEVVPDDDATYNEGDALNEKDTYAIPSLSAGGTIFGVKNQMTVKKTDAGTVAVKPVIRSGGTDYVGAEANLATGYTTEAHIWEDNPDDSNAWEEADLASAEAGMQITSYP